MYLTVKIQVSIRNLQNLVPGNETNPTCTFLAHNLESKNDDYIEIGHTEIVVNNSNPDFIQKFKSYYIFEINQPIKFEIYNYKSPKSASKKQLIGVCETDIFHLIKSNQPLTLDIHNNERNGTQGQLILSFACQ